MQAIQTKKAPPTETKSQRIKASCERRTKFFPWDHSKDNKGNHKLACNKLRAIFAKEDKNNYNTPILKNPWMDNMTMGQLKDGSYVHVFEGKK